MFFFLSSELWRLPFIGSGLQTSGWLTSWTLWWRFWWTWSTWSASTVLSWTGRIGRDSSIAVTDVRRRAWTLKWCAIWRHELFTCSGKVCNSYSYGVRAVIKCLPAWFRFVQCLRRYRDTKRAFPHLVNAGKYSTSFFVVAFAALYSTHRGKPVYQEPNSGPSQSRSLIDRNYIYSRVPI